ncbi:heme ABC transporter ATP-binding protein [Bdellovibrio sp. HCB209]|uniref:heme ABC transporter ATP-binding protein n=1 Tax=Bdellovibrio sp. HCB209 TaxID=3394354 RepID=UPI0039B3CF63
MKPLVQVQDVSFKIRDKHLLQNISLSLYPGELVVIIGRNGAGKSTLLKQLTGELTPYAGKIQILDKDLNNHDPKELAQRRAVLAQSTHLSFNYQVLEVVMLGRIPHQRFQKESHRDHEVALRAIKSVGLEGYEERDYLTLSGGEQQRVHLARVLAQLEGPALEKILFLDEPTSSLDIAHQHQVLKIAKEFAKGQHGVLAVLHDLNLASQYADRIVILSDGQVAAMGAPREVLTAKILSEAFHHPVQILEHPILGCPLIV